MKKLRNFIFVFAFASFAFFGVAGNLQAAKPSDFGLKEGNLISAIFSDDPDVYIINNDGYKRLFLNEEIFNFYGHLGGFFNVKLVPQEVVDSFPTSGLFRNCEADDPRVFGVSVEGEDTGTMSWINMTAEEALAEDPDFFKKVFCVNDKEFKWYPKKGEFKSLKSVPNYERKKHKIKELKEKKRKIKEHANDDDDEFYKRNFKNVGKILLCHKDKKTIRVSLHALRGHLRHGDEIGACFGIVYDDDEEDEDKDDDKEDKKDHDKKHDDDDDNDDKKEHEDDYDNTIDTVSPLISNIVATSTKDTSVDIKWETNEASTSKVYYSTSTPVLAVSATSFIEDTALVNSHTINLTGLTASTTYYFLVESTDTSGNTAKSQEGSFTTK